ncbi:MULTISPECIES: hypothetical protein [Actinomadura]|uniref:Uncharacterized protein n=1 Tax=Actinomadura litoris TaxID=2678616 RepID=A0A7K1L6Z8_9ACTN|nr:MULTISPECIES: hypothetical protein [Actinomadura]MBT2209364.1 hypothetical protein [Actinomadura sp. NEAU-AAG7]MUN40056.1 hypothetical protein [Actinomadura litoris]
MRLRLRLFQAAGHRVVQPWRPLRHTALSDPEGHGWLVGDREGLARLAGLFSFAAYSRRTLVHVPLRDGAPIDGDEGFLESCGGRVDLLLAHHSLGFPATRWPGVRRRLAGGTPLSVRPDGERTVRDAAAWEARVGRQGFRDWLRPVTHARTLCLTGSRDAFACAATEFAYALEHGPGKKRVSRGEAALVASLTGLFEPEDAWPRRQLEISYKQHPSALRTR